MDGSLIPMVTVWEEVDSFYTSHTRMRLAGRNAEGAAAGLKAEWFASLQLGVDFPATAPHVEDHRNDLIYRQAAHPRVFSTPGRQSVMDRKISGAIEVRVRFSKSR